MRGKLLLACLLAVSAGCSTGAKPGETAADSKMSAVLPATQPAVVAAMKVAPTSQPMAHYGNEMALPDSQTIPVQNILSSSSEYAGKQVRFTGIVSAVCPAKGCWLRVTPEPGAGSGDVFVKFQDPPEGRLIPMEAVGHDITVEGTLRDGMMSEAQAKHLKQDAGASDAEINKIVGPQKQVMIGKPGVLIEGLKQPEQTSN